MVEICSRLDGMPLAIELAQDPIVTEYDLSRLALITWGTAPMDEARSVAEALMPSAR